ncbi:D-glycerate dehydrogenase [Candidatus Bathyarchaeota archaeon]|nr:D-glycerate dehydrogenase [Candidatus Bathyarchaeota archaeon]
MSKSKVYVTRRLFSEAIEILEKEAQVEIFESEDDPIPRELLLKKVKDIDGLLPMLTDNIDAELMDRAKKLKVVSNYAVGYNNIDVDAATSRGIMVTNTPDVLTDTTADCAFMLLMAISRRVVEVDKYMRDGKWVKAWGPRMLLGSDINGKTLGLVGIGRIGSAMVPRAKGFNMNVIYTDVARNPEKEKALGIKYRKFNELLREADYVSVHVPLTKETHHLISEKELKAMKPTAYLINTSRGPVVDEKALYNALKNRTIAGAALDVHEKEPVDLDDPLLTLDNVIMTPHIASATVETRVAMATRAANNLAAALRGERPRDLVNPQVLP